MHAFSYFLSQAKDIIRPIWSSDGTRVAASSMRWLFGEDGAWPFARFAERMLNGKIIAKTDPKLGETVCHLAEEIFALEVEVAARKAGWCPELSGPPVDTDDP